MSLRTGSMARVAPRPRIFATVWDGGGRDTFDLSDYDTGVRVDLRPGMSSTFSRGQLADLGGGPNGGDARGNIFNALQYKGDPRSLIEKAIGGSGSDVLYGNAAANTLRGEAGNDRLCGSSGRDTLVGGKGADVFIFKYSSHSRPGACDRIVAGDGAAAFEKPGRGTGTASTCTTSTRTSTGPATRTSTSEPPRAAATSGFRSRGASPT